MSLTNTNQPRIELKTKEEALKTELYEFRESHPNILYVKLEIALSSMGAGLTKIIFCNDCEQIDNTFGYMVHPQVWAEATPDFAAQATPRRYKGILCWTCLEKRLHRKLTKSDFPDCPINTNILYAFDR